MYDSNLFEIDDNVFHTDNINYQNLVLRDWQRQAEKFFYDNGNKAIFEVTTGAGKTFVGIDIINNFIKNNPKFKVLIIVPKNVILETGWYKELVDYGFPIQNIGVYYGDIKEYAQVTITNIQNVKKIPLEIFDMCVYDELHNMATTNLLPVVEYPFKIKLGLTATLKRLDGNHVKMLKHFDYNIYKYSSKEALDDNVLNPFKFYNISVELDEESFDKYTELKVLINNIYHIYGNYEKIMKLNTPIKFKMLSLLNEQKKLVNNYQTKFNVAVNIIKQFKDRKIIVFNQFNDQTSRMYWYLLDDNISCRVLHSGISKDKRDQVLIDYKNDKFNVLLTSKVLDEGYNLPKLDIAIIMAGDSTDKQTIQRMGRVLRKKDDSSKLFQIYCVNTFEENHAMVRAKMFKSLAIDYKDITYNENENYIY